MLEDRPRVEQAVIDRAGRRGYDVQRSAEAFAGRMLFLRYRSVLGQNDRVEVDLNYLFRLPLAENETRFLWQPGGLDRPQVRTVAMRSCWAENYSPFSTGARPGIFGTRPICRNLWRRFLDLPSSGPC